MIPVELMTMGGSTILSAVMTMWSQSMRDKNEQFNNAIKGLTKQYDNQKEQLKADPGFAFTRRILAFLIAGGAMLAIFFPALWEYLHLLKLLKRLQDSLDYSKILQ